MSDDDFRHESVHDPRSIVAYLRAITAGIEKGHLQFGAAEQLLELHPKGMLGFEVRAKRKGGRVELAIELHWREGDEVDPATNTLTISAE
jgi:amphi-Trp domain-containing protein